MSVCIDGIGFLDGCFPFCSDAHARAGALSQPEKTGKMLLCIGPLIAVCRIIQKVDELRVLFGRLPCRRCVREQRRRRSRRQGQGSVRCRWKDRMDHAFQANRLTSASSKRGSEWPRRTEQTLRGLRRSFARWLPRPPACLAERARRGAGNLREPSSFPRRLH